MKGLRSVLRAWRTATAVVLALALSAAPFLASAVMRAAAGNMPAQHSRATPTTIQTTDIGHEGTHAAHASLATITAGVNAAAHVDEMDAHAQLSCDASCCTTYCHAVMALLNEPHAWASRSRPAFEAAKAARQSPVDPDQIQRPPSRA